MGTAMKSAVLLLLVLVGLVCSSGAKVRMLFLFLSSIYSGMAKK